MKKLVIGIVAEGVIKMLDNWEEVKRICKQAAKFENDLKAIVERIYYN